MKVTFQFRERQKLQNVLISWGFSGRFLQSRPKVCPSKASPVRRRFNCTSQFMERVGFNALSDNRNKLGMQNSV